MKLDGIHHITAITGDAPANVEFYAGVLGLRLVKKTVNQDDPTVYHLFYADEKGSPGADLTFFEYPHAARGVPGAGMVHRIVWRVADPAALDFWEQRLSAHGTASRREGESLRFSDHEGLDHELSIDNSGDAPLIADTPGVPAEHALRGFAGVHAYAQDPAASEALMAQTLGFEHDGEDRWLIEGENRHGFYRYGSPPAEHPRQGAGSVHHIAFASTMDDHEAWRQRIAAAGQRPTPVIDRFYFRSIYFREPSGVLFEIATIGPGFSSDEDAAHLGERLSLPPSFEPLRSRLEQALTPLPNPRTVPTSS
ncbi:MAG TPA: VOC family protein [Solirubrobacteraceae bacterium]|jgi:glyoxalase family protein|nr:VOC family protein [Solirubrobacteraceae bacterium]